MPIAVTSDQRGAYNNAPGGIATTNGFAVTAGDVLVVMFGAQPGSGAPTCADLIGNTYGSASLLVANGFNNYIWAWVIISSGSHAANLVTVTHDATAYQQLAVHAINPGTDGAIDVSATAIDFFVSSITVGPFTTTTADQVAIMMAYDHFNNNQPFTPGTQDGGYTLSGGLSGTEEGGGCAQYNIFSSIKTATSATLTSNMNFPVAALITISVTTGGGGGGNVGLAEGSCTVSGSGLTLSIGVGSSAGTGAASGAGKTLSIGVGSSSGICTATADGFTLSIGVGSSAGIVTASAAGLTLSLGSGSSAGTSSVAADGKTLCIGVGSGSGTGACSAAGLTLSIGVGSASGSCTVVGVSGGYSGNAEGTCTVVGVGVTLSIGVGLAAGTCTVNGYPPSFYGFKRLIPTTRVMKSTPSMNPTKSTMDNL